MNQAMDEGKACTWDPDRQQRLVHSLQTKYRRFFTSQRTTTMSLTATVSTLHNVYFVKYDVTVSFLAQVLDTVYFVSHEFVVDTVTYFGGNHGSRV